MEYLRAVKERVAEKTGLPAKAVEDLFDPAGNPFADKHPVKLHLIRPKTALATDGGLEFIPAEMKARIALGEAAAREYFGKIPVVQTVR
ncbi:MAG: hypothetical protein H7Z75_22105 [Ferruginibacter sp.]|nr:hypothetical protein [Cytophagales bacterium]